MRRRDLIASLALSAAGAAAARSQLPPVRTITRGPAHHWFGYYDKLEFDPSSRLVLGQQVDFEHRSPRPDDVIRVGFVDTGAGDAWNQLGTSRAWNWQQGCMLQWVPGSSGEVIWNDRQGDQFVAHIQDVRSGRRRTIPSHVYALSPDGKWAVTTDFRRLNSTRPGYGYAGGSGSAVSSNTPDDIGIWRVDLATGVRQLLFSLKDAAAVPYDRGDFSQAVHWFNHLLVSPDGGRVIFLHRWRGEKEGKGFGTRMFTIGATGAEPYVLDPYGKTSHFIWRDGQHVLAWAWHPSSGDRFYLYRDRTSDVEVVGEGAMTQNGHCTYLPGNAWILNDTYPDRQRLQHPYLYHVRTGVRYPLGHFHSPPEYTGEWRCDTHPRFSPDGRKVVIDSPHGGHGRQLHLIDISEIVG